MDATLVDLHNKKKKILQTTVHRVRKSLQRPSLWYHPVQNVVYSKLVPFTVIKLFFMCLYSFVGHLSSYTSARPIPRDRYNISDYGQSFSKGSNYSLASRGLCGFWFQFGPRPRIVLCGLTGHMFAKTQWRQFQTENRLGAGLTSMTRTTENCFQIRSKQDFVGRKYFFANNLRFKCFC